MGVGRLRCSCSLDILWVGIDQEGSGRDTGVGMPDASGRVGDVRNDLVEGILRVRASHRDDGTRCTCSVLNIVDRNVAVDMVGSSVDSDTEYLEKS